MRIALLFVIACGAQSTPEASQDNAPAPPQTAADEPATQSPEEPTVQSPTPDTGPVVSYSIDGTAVDEATFEALFNRLDVDEAAYGGESVVEPDGSYGGAGQLFHARDGDVQYRYEFHTHPRDDGREGQSRMLFRE